jgi:hypothetical protein
MGRTSEAVRFSGRRITNVRRLVPLIGHRAVRSIVACLVLATVGAACSGSDEPESVPPSVTSEGATSSAPSTNDDGSATTVATSSPGSASGDWFDVVGRIGADGEVPLDVALEAFARAVGPLPGVSAPAEPVFSLSGTTAAYWLLRHWDDLSADQQRAADAYFQAPVGADTQALAGPWNLAVATPAAMFAADDQGWECTKNQAIEVEVAALIVDIGVRAFPAPEIEYTSCVVDPALTATTRILPLSTEGDYRSGFPAKCVVLIPEPALDDPTWEAHRREILAYLVFECFQLGLSPDLTVLYNYPTWILAGTARWVAAKLARAEPYRDGSWLEWVSTPNRPLFARVLDAVGFFDLVSVEELVGWENLLPTLEYLYLTGAAEPSAGVSRNAYEAVMNKFSLLSWGSGYFDDPHAQGVWDQDRPHPEEFYPTDYGEGPFDDVPLELGSVSNGGSFELEAQPYAAGAFVLDLGADVVLLQPTHRGSLGTTIEGHSDLITVNALELVSTSHAEFVFVHEDLLSNEEEVDLRPLNGRILMPDQSIVPLPDGARSSFCMLASGCQCPEGSPRGDEQPEPMQPGEAWFGLTGHHDGSTLEVEGLSLDDFCGTRRGGRPERYLLTGGTWDWSEEGGPAVNGCFWPSAFGSGEFGPDVEGSVSIDLNSKPRRWLFGVNFSTRLDPVTVPECRAESGQRKHKEFEHEYLVSSLWGFSDINDPWVPSEGCSVDYNHAWGGAPPNIVAWHLEIVDGYCGAPNA